MEALKKREEKMWEKSRQKRVNGWCPPSSVCPILTQPPLTLVATLTLLVIPSLPFLLIRVPTSHPSPSPWRCPPFSCCRPPFDPAAHPHALGMLPIFMWPPLASPLSPCSASSSYPSSPLSPCSPPHTLHRPSPLALLLPHTFLLHLPFVHSRVTVLSHVYSSPHHFVCS